MPGEIRKATRWERISAIPVLFVVGFLWVIHKTALVFLRIIDVIAEAIYRLGRGRMGTSKRVLVVSGRDMTCFGLTRILEGFGYTVIAAGSQAELLEMIPGLLRNRVKIAVVDANETRDERVGEGIVKALKEADSGMKTIVLYGLYRSIPYEYGDAGLRHDASIAEIGDTVDRFWKIVW